MKKGLLLICLILMLLPISCGRGPETPNEPATSNEPESSNGPTSAALKTVRADFAGNGYLFDVTVSEDGDGYRIRVLECSEVLFEKRLSVFHPEWNSFSLCDIGGIGYILEYNPYMAMGLGAYSYSLYGWSGEDRSFNILDQGTVQFDLNKDQIPGVRLGEFEEKVNSYIAESTVIISTLDGEVLTSGKLKNMDASSIISG